MTFVKLRKKTGVELSAPVPFYENMDQTNNKYSPEEIIDKLSSELTVMLNEHTAYGKGFSKVSGLEFSSTSNDERKEFAKRYYKYASHLAGSLTIMENILSGISAIIIDADKNQQYNRILLCDEILSSYGNLKTAISSFATQNEHLIAMDTLSVSDMIKLHAELSYKFSYFKNFLTQHRR